MRPAFSAARAIAWRRSSQSRRCFAAASSGMCEFRTLMHAGSGAQLVEARGTSLFGRRERRMCCTLHPTGSARSLPSPPIPGKNEYSVVYRRVRVLIPNLTSVLNSKLTEG